MSNLRYKLEALLFSSARSMKIDELCNLTKASPEEVREGLNELKKDYEQRDSSITLIDEGTSFKLNVKSEHAPMIHQVVTETELSKTLMETLAVIAFKYPIKQSDLIKIRTNKAYDHLRELEGMDYITRQKYGRTKLIKLTPKFFEYFDLPPEKLKEKFEDFGGIANAIKEKEDEVKKMKEEIKKKAKEAGKKKEGQEIDLVDKEGHKQKLEVYEKAEKEQEEVQPYIERVGNLEVTDVPEKEETAEEEPEEGEDAVDEMKGMVEPEEESEGKSDQPKEAEESKEPSEEAESEVDKRVEELLHPKEAEETPEKEPESEEEPKEGAGEEPEKETEEPKDLLEAAAEEEEKKKKDENIPS